MNTTDLPVRPDVSAFVARVRELLADLSDEDRLELTEGLEADLTDQVAEHGGAVLGDPEGYTRELRAAGGFDPAPRQRVRQWGRALPTSLEDARAKWDELVATRRVAPAWSVLAALRPAWWVLRAWVAAMLLARLVPGWYQYGLTWLPGVHAVLGLTILAVCVVGSALVGMGRIWPGARPAGARGLGARVVLVVLNVGAVIAVPYLNGQLDQFSWQRYSQGYNEAQWEGAYGKDRGVVNRGQQVCNIAAYDAAGQPLTGVQLFDQRGRPLEVDCFGQQDKKVPWILGDVMRWNVYPLGERARPARTPERRADLSDAAFPTPDRATTPEVTNPLVPKPVVRAERPGKDEGKRGADAEKKGKRGTS